MKEKTFFFLTKTGLSINFIYKVQDNVYSNINRAPSMKLKSLLTVVIVLTVFQVLSCSKITGDLDDQAPKLWVTIEIANDPTNIIQISDTNKAYLVYYSNDDWTNPWLQHGTDGNMLVNPTVGSFTLYLMAFWDADGNGVVDAGEPCTGYLDKTHSGTPEELTKLELLPLEWKSLTITLDPARVY